MSAVPALLVVAVVVVVMLGAVGMFAYLYGRRRVFTRGVRGTAVVVAVRPTAALERHSVVERPTERVTVATAARPQGVLTDQKVPAGQYLPGQVVAVVQAPGRPDRLYLDRPDLERSALSVYAPLLLAVCAPFIAVLGVTNGLRG
ncbi:hypothetical protein ACTHAM_000233 [Cellulomonas soli]|uniref:hypothetical protein n=1 Tax=Cellulomonas soli TaxID=931535 RepID=UPI003F83B4A9